MSSAAITKKTYVAVYAALMILVLVTVGVAYLDLGLLNVVAAMTIAFFKAILVALYFMHVRTSSRLVWVVAGAGVYWLVILLALTMSDFLTRAWITIPTF
ncbi:MAG: cytochrome C oxidase subunit IV family protein [Elusimicrobia bacterium]|nr:cytochrome C oxidase subunit IV family protein [Elusimicrobiota bacterium]